MTDLMREAIYEAFGLAALVYAGYLIELWK
jgi:hypothetical protein